MCGRATTMLSTLFRSIRNGSSPPAWLFIAAGINYPLWWFVAPGPVDPFGIWLAIATGFVILGTIAALRSPAQTPLHVATVALASAVTVQFFLLANWNSSPFYYIGSTMAMVTTLLFIRLPKLMVAYGALVLMLSTALYLDDPQPQKLAYWVAPVPVFFFAYQRLNAQNALERRLEHRVEERTRQLSEANQRLREEIATRVRLEESLRVQDKVEAVARMAGGISHDFNNLLTTIGVYAELIDHALPADSPLRVEVSHIQHAQRQAASLTHQLLTLGRNSHVWQEVIDLSETISGMRSLLQRVLAGHEVVVTLQPGRHLVRANLDQVRQVALNLALNARDAMTGHGRLSIEIARHPRSSLSEKLGTALDHEEYVLLAVTDTGIGMNEETRSRAFDPFFSTKPPDRGSGLGLSTIHAIVSQANGHVRLSSEPGLGARFELYWPFARDLPESAHPSVPQGSGMARSARILLVEDQEPVRTALRRVLMNAGHVVADVADGEQALAILDDSDTPFDLVITDVVMPGMTGFELAERIAKARPDAKVMLMSGHLNDRSLSDAEHRFAFLAKPFTPNDLEHRVRELLS
jgi:signal transduction histidine kinase